jgi:hypothetical protein
VSAGFVHRQPTPVAYSHSVDALAERLANPAAFLSRTDLRELGLERRAVDAIFRACPVVALPGYSRPLIRVSDYLALIEESSYRDDRVRPVCDPST